MSEQVDDRVLLTAIEAISLLHEGERIHTFRSCGMALIGADWDRAEIIDAINASEIVEVGGDGCRAMNHGLVVWTGDLPLFVECRKGSIEEFEKNRETSR